jgi:hypothetical protein
MGKIRYALFIGLFVIAGALSAQGAVVSGDDPVFGPGSIVVDLSTGHQWLSPHFSLNRSIQDVSAQFGAGGEFEGFRYATQAELTALWQSAGMSIGFGFPTGPYTAFLSLMGGPTEVITPGVYERIVVAVDTQASPGSYFAPDVGLFGAQGFANPNNCCISITQADPGRGAALVRVPAVSRWDGDSVTGATAIDPANGNNGTLVNGASVAPGCIGNAFMFDGIDDYIEIAHHPSLNMTGPFSIDVWVKPNTVIGNHRIFGKGGWQPHEDYILVFVGDRLQFNIAGPGNTFAQINSVQTIAPGEWTHVAATFDGNTMRVYVNGVEDPITASHQTIGTGSARAWIGMSPDHPAVEPFDGLIDQVRIYNRFLSAAEIGDIVAATAQCRPLSADFFLRGAGSTGNPATLFLDDISPVASTAKYKDSPAVTFSGGNPWQTVGTWTANPGLSHGFIAELSEVRVWLGLKNSDDQGTQFDVRAEVYKNDELIASGLSRCISGITRNANKAKEVATALDMQEPTQLNGATDVLSLVVSTRIGTNPDNTKCAGHNNAVGLRLYFDAVDRVSRFGAVAE